MKAKKQKSHANKATYELRVQSIVQVILDGAETWDIFQFVAEQEDEGKAPWEMGRSRKHICERQIRNYIADANKRIIESSVKHDADALRHHLSKRRNLYARAVNAGDINTALAVLRDTAALQDLYPAKKVNAEHSGELKIVIEADDNFYGKLQREDGDMESPPTDGPPTPGSE